jgi:hypothetical protein
MHSKAEHMLLIGPGGLLLVASHTFCSPSFSFKGKVEKKQIPTNAPPPFPCFEAIQLDELSPGLLIL